MLKKIVSFNKKSVLELLNLMSFLNMSSSASLRLWILKNLLDASRQVDVIIVSFDAICDAATIVEVFYLFGFALPCPLP